MLAIRNGLKTALRTPGKTLLFTVILTVTAALLTVCCCVFGAVRGYLADCDEYFHTIAELEYMGKDYPDSQVWDQDLAAAVEENRETLTALLASDPVLAWEPASRELAYTPVIHRLDTSIPDPDAAVLRVKLYTYNEQIGTYNAMVTETLYSRIDYTDKLIMFRTADGEPPLETNNSYLVAGRFYAGRLQNPSFRQELVTITENGTIRSLPAALPQGADPAEEALFLRYAEILQKRNEAFRVTYTAALEDLYPFHQQLLKLTAGRFFTREEYENRAHVCIVSERVAGRLELTVGDRIPFTVFRSQGELYDDTKHQQVDKGDYEIVGILAPSDTYSYWIFLPDAGRPSELRPVNGYSLGQFRLKNDGVPAFLEAAAPLFDRGFRLNVYDQGYSAATEPMEELLFISGIFLAVCLLLAVCAMALQSYIFISRQRETARTMHHMGSGWPHIFVYYLSAALALSLAAVVLGALIGKLVEGRVFALLKDFALQFADQDLRFSTSRLAIVRTLDFDPVSSMYSYLTAGLILLVGITVFTLVFSAESLRQKQTKKRRKKLPRLRLLPTRSTHLSGFFQYGLLSIRRGSLRTLAVLLLGLVTASFFGNLTASLTGYEVQLAAYRKNTVLSGSATDMLGRQISGLVLKAEPIAALASDPLVENCCVTTNLGYIQFLGVVGGEQLPFNWSYYGSYVYESSFYWMSKGPVWTGVSSISNSPLFHYSESGSVEWLEGWSEADFIRLEDREATVTNYETDRQRTVTYRGGPAVCALPKAMMEEYGIQLGDEINTAIAYYHERWDMLVLPMQLRVVASYVGPVGSTTVFSPITLVRPESEDRGYFPRLREGSDETYLINRVRWTGAELARFQALGLSPFLTYTSFTFTLTDSLRLDELRRALSEAGFTWVRSGERTKNYALIEDEVYLNTVHSMERQIQYVGVLYDALYLLTGVIGFALAWLLVQSRRREIAVMRALGTQPGRILLNFLLEQLVLMAAGLGLGLLVCRFTDVRFSQTQGILTAAFLGIWCLATLLCLCAALRKRSFAALTEPE